MCQSGPLRLCREHENSSSWVGVEQGRGCTARNRVLCIQCTVTHELQHRVVPDWRQFIFTLQKYFFQLGNIVKVERHFVVDLFNAKELEWVEEDDVLLLKPLRTMSTIIISVRGRYSYQSLKFMPIQEKVFGQTRRKVKSAYHSGFIDRHGYVTNGLRYWGQAFITC